MHQAFSWVVAQRPAVRALMSQRTTLGRIGSSGRICANAASTMAVVRVSVFSVV